MGIKALCSAFAVVAGVGAADAATVDHVKLTLNAEYICEMEPCEDPAPGIGDFYGIQPGTAMYGDLYIGDRDADWLQTILFISKGAVYNFGQFIDWASSGNYQNDEASNESIAFLINWNGSEGSLWYRDDNAPWSLNVQGTIELAPVPLPATAALLPMGLGALAMMRRRRRSA